MIYFHQTRKQQNASRGQRAETNIWEINCWIKQLQEGDRRSQYTNKHHDNINQLKLPCHILYTPTWSSAGASQYKPRRRYFTYSTNDAMVTDCGRQVTQHKTSVDV